MEQEELDDDIEVVTEDIIINEIKETVIDEENKKEWDEFNEKWRNKLKSKEKIQ